jgi:dTDP-4-amino-4,6-dideoxygalactose transaminase
MPASIPLLDLSREHALIADEVQRAWAETMRDMHLLNGPQVAAFEREIAAYLGVAHARGTSSGTDALILALAALRIGAGDRVILPANVFIAALEAVHHVGARPVLVDAEADGFGPDREAIESALPARAVLVVHLYGAPLDLGQLGELCGRAGTHLVEDGSHAHGARRGGRFVGSVGTIGCFSAGVVKNLGAYGDAGFVTTDDAALASEIGRLQRHGQRAKNDHVRYGWNARLDELHAAVLRIKLRFLEPRNQRRRDIAAFYGERLAPLGLRVPGGGADEHAVYHQYVVRTEQRDALQAHLASRGIETGIHYPVPLHRQLAWTRAYGATGSFPRAERLAHEVLSLPVFPDLTDAEVETVADAVASFFRGAALRPPRPPAADAVRVEQ